MRGPCKVSCFLLSTALMSHEQGKAATMVNSGRGHQGFNLKFLLRGKVLAGARGSCPAGNHVWAGPAVRRSEHVSQASCNCPVIYYFLLHWKREICFWFSLRHRILITRVANLWMCNVILSVKMSPWLYLAGIFLRLILLICACICNSPFVLWDNEVSDSSLLVLLIYFSDLPLLISSLNEAFLIFFSARKLLMSPNSFFFVPRALLVLLCFPGISWFLEVDRWILACDYLRRRKPVSFAP